MSNPTSVINQVGIQSAIIYPYGGVYNNTTQEVLSGLQYVNIGVNVTDAQGFGGESVFELFSAETKREIDVQFSQFGCTLNALKILLGGDLAVDASDGAANAGSGAGTEVQVFSSNLNDRAPFFRLEAYSNIGTGLLKIVFPKLRVTGNVKWDFKAESIHMPEFSARALFDKTYTRFDNKVGAPYDWFYGDAQQATRHS